MDTDSGDVVTVAFSSSISHDGSNVYVSISYSCEEDGGNHTVLGVNDFKATVWSAPPGERIIDVTCRGGPNFVATPKPRGENHGFLSMPGIEGSYWGSLSYRVDSSDGNDAPKVGTIGTVQLEVTALPR